MARLPQTRPKHAPPENDISTLPDWAQEYIACLEVKFMENAVHLLYHCPIGMMSDD